MMGKSDPADQQSTAEDIRIERLTTLAQMIPCEEVARRVWGLDDLQIIPAHEFDIVARHGGIILGAYHAKTDELIAWSYALLAKVQGQLGLYSFGLAVVPEYQRHGVGRRLKLAQREAALAEDHKLIAWTYDPLRAINGHLYLTRLGAVTVEYLEDTHGPRGMGTRAQGMPIDEVLTVWYLDSPRVTKRLSGQETISALPDWPVIHPLQSPQDADGRVRIDELPQSSCVLEIPEEIQDIRETDIELARKWRFTARDILEHYFNGGYTISECISQVHSTGRRNFCLIEPKGHVGGMPDSSK